MLFTFKSSHFNYTLGLYFADGDYFKFVAVKMHSSNLRQCFLSHIFLFYNKLFLFHFQAYPKSAYMYSRGHDPYTGQATNIPSPPPLYTSRLSPPPPFSQSSQFPLEASVPRSSQEPAQPQPARFVKLVILYFHKITLKNLFTVILNSTQEYFFYVNKPVRISALKLLVYSITCGRYSI